MIFRDRDRCGAGPRRALTSLVDDPLRCRGRGRACSTLPVVGSNFCTLAKWVERARPLQLHLSRKRVSTLFLSVSIRGPSPERFGHGWTRMHTDGAIRSIRHLIYESGRIRFHATLDFWKLMSTGARRPEASRRTRQRVTFYSLGIRG